MPKAPAETPQASSNSQANEKTNRQSKVDTPQPPRAEQNLSPEQIVEKFGEYINQITFISDAGIETSRVQTDKFVKDLQNWEDKNACIVEYGIDDYVNLCKDSLLAYKSIAQALVYNFCQQFNADASTNAELLQEVNNRLNQRESDLDRLQATISAEETPKVVQAEESDASAINWNAIIGCIVIVVVLLFLTYWIVKLSKKRGKKSKPVAQPAASSAPGIVVRRTTTSILKKQSLEDVIDNPSYLRIDCADFCTDSAVRRIYLKNTCVKDIYNMYAEDLRNPNNPKEDGCMVLGRWVYDADAGDYYVSLEHVILPGDDAVFEEYALNFGGKIKLKVAEKLRKLRRETNLQYDLTCWVHSHPGLGVFFSNADDSAHRQLKHPTHPLFLTAIVVDILTPEQELGIFTFKKDGSINAKTDLTRMYSLEKLYKWAVDSDRNTFKAEDHYNALARAAKRTPDCAEVQLNNGAIIDMGMMVTEQDSGLLAFVHGFADKQGAKVRYVATTMSEQEAVPDNELIGCFVTATHCSIPSVKRAVTNYLTRINFVIVASSSDGVLTTIPVTGGELCSDANYYGEEKFEDLKVWTRRKR